MTHAGYVLTGWAVTWAVLGVYAWWLVRKGKHLTSLVPAEERRWSSPGSRGTGASEDSRTTAP